MYIPDVFAKFKISINEFRHIRKDKRIEYIPLDYILFKLGIKDTPLNIERLSMSDEHIDHITKKLISNLKLEFEIEINSQIISTIKNVFKEDNTEKYKILCNKCDVLYTQVIDNMKQSYEDLTSKYKFTMGSYVSQKYEYVKHPITGIMIESKILIDQINKIIKDNALDALDVKFILFKLGLNENTGTEVLSLSMFEQQDTLFDQFIDIDHNTDEETKCIITSKLMINIDKLHKQTHKQTTWDIIMTKL